MPRIDFEAIDEISNDGLGTNSFKTYGDFNSYRKTMKIALAMPPKIRIKNLNMHLSEAKKTLAKAERKLQSAPDNMKPLTKIHKAGMSGGVAGVTGYDPGFHYDKDDYKEIISGIKKSIKFIEDEIKKCEKQLNESTNLLDW